jgi:hypothetical protein
VYALGGIGVAWHELIVDNQRRDHPMTWALAAGAAVKTWCPAPGQWLEASLRVLAMPDTSPSPASARGVMPSAARAGLAAMFTLGFVLNE